MLFDQLLDDILEILVLTAEGIHDRVEQIGYPGHEVESSARTVVEKEAESSQSTVSHAVLDVLELRYESMTQKVLDFGSRTGRLYSQEQQTLSRRRSLEVHTAA